MADALFLKPGERLIVDQERLSKIIILPTVANADAFAVLSDSQFGRNGRFELLLCSKVNHSQTENATRVACRTMNRMAVPVPASTLDNAYPFSGNTFSFTSIDFNEMSSFTWLAIIDHGGPAGGFLVAEPFKKSTNTQVIRQSMLCKFKVL